MHQTVGNILRTLCHTHPPATLEGARDLVDRALATAQLALRVTQHSTLGSLPGAIVFGRDMLLEVPYVADLLLMRQRRQRLIDYNVIRENRRRYRHDYRIGDEVLEIIPKENRPRLAAICKGPYRVVQVHTNGTITVEPSHGVTERVSIRNFKPYHRRNENQM